MTERTESTDRAPSHPDPAGAAARDDWRDAYRRRLFVTDTISVAWAVAGAHLISFGLGSSSLEVSGVRALSISYLAVSVVMGLAWVILLQLAGSRDHRVIGTESTEYRRVVRASFSLFGAVAVIAYLLKTDIARGYLISALPLGLAVLLLSRWMWRQWLRERRERGEDVYRVALLGTRLNVEHLARELHRNSAAGYRVVGAVIPGDSRPLVVGTEVVPVSSDLDAVLDDMERWDADTVAVTGTDQLPPDKLRELSWSLEPGRRHLVVAPSLTDIAGPRLHTRPVSGLPLIHVETPRYEGPKLYGKRAFDLAAAGLLVLLLSPLLLLVSILVKSADGGPVLFRQRRVGWNGKDFHMLKFRSMVVDAEARLKSLDKERDAGNSVLFKVKDDPRITNVGRVLRRFSLDELPQLFNVLAGDMSLVGPRPPLAAEVEQYEEKVRRRFLVKPGVTGLWQVSGRSDLSWEESVRLDLYYVENWSMTTDLTILWRTFNAVIASRGAY